MCEGNQKAVGDKLGDQSKGEGIDIDKGGELLEDLNIKRTFELAKVNKELKREILERKRAEEQLENRNVLLSTLLNVSNLISSSLDIEPLLEAILDQLKGIIDYSGANVFIIEGNKLKLVAHRSSLTDEQKANNKFTVSQAPEGLELIINKKPIIISDIYDNNNLSENFGSTLGEHIKSSLINTRSWMGIPLMVKEKVIGALTLEHAVPGFYLKQDIEIGMTFANQVAIELENVRLYNENARLFQDEHQRHLEDEQRRRIAEGLRDVLAKLNSNRPLKDILKFIVDQAVNLMGADAGALYEIHKDTDMLTIEAVKEVPEQFLDCMEIPVENSIIGNALEGRKPVVISDALNNINFESIHDPKRMEHLKWISANFYGLVAVPLVCKDEVYGGIILYYKEAHDFKKDEIDLAMTYADQAALAIDNARLRAQTEEIAVAAERSRIARDLHDAVTQTLFSTSLIAEVLPKIWDKNPEQGKTRLEEIRQLTRGALAEMRTLLLELRPATLVEASLEDLLKQLSEAANGRARLPVNLNIENNINLPTDVKIVFYRIAQEALNNISKHSNASNVSISLLNDKSKVELKIADNGKGFDPCEVSGEHLGLGIMCERASAVGARFVVDSTIGKGTEITITWEA